MNAKVAICMALVLVAGCFQPAGRKPKPKEPEVVIQPSDTVDAATLSAALARLAERQKKSASVTDGTRRLYGTLNELVQDGVPQAYVDSVRKAVPAIKPATKAEPARNLTDQEIETLRAVR